MDETEHWNIFNLNLPVEFEYLKDYTIVHLHIIAVYPIHFPFIDWKIFMLSLSLLIHS